MPVELVGAGRARGSQRYRMAARRARRGSTSNRRRSSPSDAASGSLSRPVLPTSSRSRTGSRSSTSRSDHRRLRVPRQDRERDRDRPAVHQLDVLQLGAHERDSVALLGPDGRILADQNTSTLLITDTVENLLRPEQVIAEFDVLPREDVLTQVFELQYREPEEITGVLSAVLGDYSGSSTSSFGRDRGRASWSLQAVPRGPGAVPERPLVEPHGDQRAIGDVHPGAAPQVDHRQSASRGHEDDHRVDQEAR